MRYKLHLLTSFFASILCACGGEDGLTTEENTETQIPVIGPAVEDEVISSWLLSGLYRNAGAETPVILIVPGSGPTDLNGNNSLGVNSNSYKYLAEDLFAQGLSTVRVDKRGLFSSKAAGNPNAVTLDIYARDYRDWVKTIRETIGARCVYLLGHSEGAMMVSAAAINQNDICGLILVAGAGRPLGEILREQLQANPANFFLWKQAFEAIEALEKGNKVDVSEMSKFLKPLFYPEIQDFLISVMKHDPADLAKAANVETLIIQGTHDIQISVEDAEKLAEATEGKLVLIKGVNHILKKSPKLRVLNMMTYSKPDLPLSPEVTQAIVDFVEP